MTKCNYDIIKQEREDLMNAYRDVYTDCWTQKEAFIKTVKHTAPRYYVSPKQAYQVLCKVVDGDWSHVDTMPKSRRRMYHSLYDTLIKIAQKPESVGMSLWSLIPFAVTHPAPEFFIEPSSMAKIFAFVKSGLFEKYTSWNEAYKYKYRNSKRA